MVGYRTRSGHLRLVNLENVDEKLGEFINPAGNLLGSLKPFRVIAKQFGIVVFDHGCAGSGRGDNHVGTAEYRNEVLRSASRFGNIASIVRRLPATGLGFRKCKVDSESVENAYHRLADLREKGVYQACSE